MFKDHKDILAAFNAHGVKYLVVGGHAAGIHSEPRGTKDLDLFIKADRENSVAVFRALADFGAPLAGMSPADFNDKASTIFMVGVPPGRIDILQGIDGVRFDEAWTNRVEAMLENEIAAHIISKDDLIANKLAVGRHIDLADVEKIREATLVNSQSLENGNDVSGERVDHSELD